MKNPFQFSLHNFFGEVSLGADKIKVRSVLTCCGKKQTTTEQRKRELLNADLHPHVRHTRLRVGIHGSMYIIDSNRVIQMAV
jgi:hypothetical protein